MRNFVKDLFSESHHASMLRVMSFISVITAAAIAIIGVLKATPDYSGISLLCSTFLTAAFVGKVSQKAVESRKKD